MIRLRDIHKEYPNGTKALKGVSMQIDDGDFVFLVGPSGSGKSTIIKLITAEIAPTKGKLMVNGYNLNDISEKQIPLLRRTIGVVFQDFRLIEKKTVFENIEVAMRAVGATTSEIRRRIPYVLGLVGVIIADEPTGNLDPARSLEIMSLLEKINDMGTTILVVTHERELVNRFGKRVVAIESGRIISDAAGAYYGNGR